VAISQYVAEQFRRHYNVSNERIKLIPNGVKIQSGINQGEIDKLRRQIFTQFGIKEADNPIFLLFAANNFRLKGLDVLLKAMRLVISNRALRSCFLIVVGSDNPRRYYKHAEKTIFLGAVSDIQSILSISHIAVLPTFYDPCSRFVLEALAAGKPVITTRFNGATDLFINNRHGKVIDSPNNITELAEAIGYFTDTDNLQKASQAIAADNIKDKITIDRVAKQLIDLYELILQKGKN
jgi:UDP-glucose:(heptosyl)LPS alpha-1,3-glucosyltransferase